MSDTDSIQAYLALMDAQAASLFSALPLITEDTLWERTLPDEWSPGENLSHVAAVHRFFRRLNGFLWPIASLVAQARMHKRYEAEIDDVYMRPNFPNSIGRFWPPIHSSRHHVPLDSLIGAISGEHQLVRAFYQQRDPILLGRALLYIPAIGWISYIQSLRIAVYHDGHHFEAIRKAIA